MIDVVVRHLKRWDSSTAQNIPKHLTESRMAVDKDVMSDHLYRQYKGIKERKEKLREKLMRDELKECTFQPKLYKPPENVRASYRHHGQHSKHVYKGKTDDKSTSSNGSLDIRNLPNFIAANATDTTNSASSPKPLPLTHSLLMSPPPAVVAVDRSQIQETLTPSSEQTTGMSNNSSANKYTNGSDEMVEGGNFNSPAAVSSSSPSLSVVTEADSPPPPLPTQEKTPQLQLENEIVDETTTESHGRLRRTSSDVSSLEAAGVRELGKYDEVYHREREGISIQQEEEDHDQTSEGDHGGDDLYDNISLERSTSEDTSDILSAMISKEIEEQSQGIPFGI